MTAAVGYYLNFARSQTDLVPMVVGGSRREGPRKIPIDKPNEGHDDIRATVSLRLVQSRVVAAEWKPVDDERGIDGQPTRWQAAASSWLYNLHAPRETNGTYASQ